MPPKVREIALVIFKTDQNPNLFGVQCSKWEHGWKHSSAKIETGGVVFETQGMRPVLVPMSGIKQIEFKS